MEALSRAKLGEILKTTRKGKGLRLEDVADEVVSSTTISQIEKGNPTVRINKVNYVAEKLGLNLTELPKIKRKLEKEESYARRDLRFIEHAIETVGPKIGLERLKEAEQKYRNTSHMVIIYYLRGKSHRYKKSWFLAKKNYQHVLAELKNFPDLESLNLRAASLNELGVIAQYENQLEQALDYTQEAMECFQEEGEKQHLKNTLLLNQAIYSDRLGKLEGRVYAIKQLWKQKDRMKNVVDTLKVHEIYGRTLKQQGLYKEAIQCLEKGINLAQLNKIFPNYVVLYTTLGSIYLDLGDYTEAERCLLAALDLKSILQEKEDLFTTTFRKLGFLYMKQNKMINAKAKLKEAVRASNKSGDIQKRITALKSLGECYLSQEKLPQATEILEKAFNLSSEYYYQYKTKIISRLIRCYDQMGKQEKMREYLNIWYNSDDESPENGGDYL